jgi:3-deoxy-D-manno-octulosonic-acid transferase
MPGEEALLFQAVQTLRSDFPSLWTILAPRHPERASEIATEIESAGIPYQRRSEWRPGVSLKPGVLLLDSTGELADLYRLAAAAFIGGTLVATGGHNILEPAQFACPIVIGPSMQNFRETADLFIQAGALVQVRDTDGLTKALRELFRDGEKAKRLGEAARSVLENHASGLGTLLAELESLLAGKVGQPERLASHARAASAAR